nr:unnamed protein product [Callosobruchus analis]
MRRDSNADSAIKSFAGRGS